ncbi:unnamed protein product [marine sediment metagenome]|uniref:Uncharacterized protein n=1 Tax=marine sediment metagenome TaxID=412755 RepID=X0ZAD2_9ZZZZ
MGKFTYAVLMVFLIEMALWLFAGTEYSQSTLFAIISDPSTLLSNPLYILITVTLVAFGAAAIIPGNLFQVNIYALYAGLSAIFISFSVSIVHLWQFIYGELSGITIEFALPITILIIAPFLVTYILATVEWVRSNQ